MVARSRCGIVQWHRHLRGAFHEPRRRFGHLFSSRRLPDYQRRIRNEPAALCDVNANVANRSVSLIGKPHPTTGARARLILSTTIPTNVWTASVAHHTLISTPTYPSNKQKTYLKHVSIHDLDLDGNFPSLGPCTSSMAAMRHRAGPSPFAQQRTPVSKPLHSQTRPVEMGQFSMLRVQPQIRTEPVWQRAPTALVHPSDGI